MARKRVTGEGTPYEPDEEAQVADWLGSDDALAASEEEEGRFDVEAQVEWAGTVDANGRDGVRRTLLDGVPLDGIRAAAEKLRKAKARQPGLLRSYRDKGWRAQLRRAMSTKRGREAVRAAGLNRGTIRRWQTGKQQPSAASRAKISQAYESLRVPPRVARAQHDVTVAFTRALESRYGVTVRFRDITHLWFIE